MSDDDPLADLQRLAASQHFRLVQRGDLFWLVRLGTGLPEVNETAGSLVFSFDEVRDLLLRLSESDGGLDLQ